MVKNKTALIILIVSITVLVVCYVSIKVAKQQFLSDKKSISDEYFCKGYCTALNFSFEGERIIDKSHSTFGYGTNQFVHACACKQNTTTLYYPPFEK